MSRMPKPRWRAERGAWVCKVDGSLRTLARGKGAKGEAERVLREILRVRDRETRTGRLAAPTVAELVRRYLAEQWRRVEANEIDRASYADAVRRLGDFPEACGALGVDELRPHHVLDWLNGHGWSATTRHDYASQVKRVTDWAWTLGLIERDPLVSLKRPPKPARREKVMGRDQAEAFLGAIRTPEFALLALFLSLTGARPGEACRIEARHVDLDRGTCELPPWQHKTGKATRRPRVIDLVPEAADLLAPLVAAYPTGPLFRNSQGRAWTRSAINDQVKRIRARIGAKGKEGVICYAYRHLFAEKLLESGAGLATTASALGHSSPSLVGRVYGRLDDRREHVRSAIMNALAPES